VEARGTKRSLVFSARYCFSCCFLRAISVPVHCIGESLRKRQAQTGDQKNPVADTVLHLPEICALCECASLLQNQSFTVNAFANSCNSAVHPMIPSCALSMASVAFFY
jgi:hypothetical protein